MTSRANEYLSEAADLLDNLTVTSESHEWAERCHRLSVQLRTMVDASLLVDLPLDPGTINPPPGGSGILPPVTPGGHKPEKVDVGHCLAWMRRQGPNNTIVREASLPDMPFLPTEARRQAVLGIILSSEPAEWTVLSDMEICLTGRHINVEAVGMLSEATGPRANVVRVTIGKCHVPLILKGKLVPSGEASEHNAVMDKFNQVQAARAEGRMAEALAEVLG